MAGVFDGHEGFVRSWRVFVDGSSMTEGNDLVVFAMDDEERGVDVCDSFVVGEKVVGKDRVFECDGVSGFEWCDEDECCGFGV